MLSAMPSRRQSSAIGVSPCEGIPDAARPAPAWRRSFPHVDEAQHQMHLYIRRKQRRHATVYLPFSSTLSLSSFANRKREQNRAYGPHEKCARNGRHQFACYSAANTLLAKNNSLLVETGNQRKATAVAAVFGSIQCLQAAKFCQFPKKFPVCREFSWRRVRPALRRQPGSRGFDR